MPGAGPFIGGPARPLPTPGAIPAPQMSMYNLAGGAVPPPPPAPEVRQFKYCVSFWCENIADEE